ncbi:MAG: Flp pilus assembly complex ATPase component TadA [Clostridiaceae bacterium]|nr:Flp pilus assembly complex ATPase component TadA [Clostridiaceae bacterium]
MAAQTKQKLGDILLQTKKITEAQLQTVLKNQRITGKRLGEQLIEDNILMEDTIIDVLEVQLGIPRAYLDLMQIDIQAVRSVPQSLCEKYLLVPVEINKEIEKITVAMSDPLNIFAIEDIRIATGYEVDPMIASKDEIRKVIDRYYSSQNVQRVVDELATEGDQKDAITGNIESEEDFDEVKNAPVVKLIDSIIGNAAKAGASDIHIEPFEDYVKVRYRIDGELQEVLKTPKRNMMALVARIKILASLNIAEKRIPQDGRILTKAEGKAVDLRVSILPTVNGEKVVIRILKRDGFLVGRQQLGLPTEEMDKLLRIMSNPHGVILITGPTGSGKSTTLYTVLSDLNKSNTNIITVEDPVEYTMDGINQVSVNVKAGLTFAAGLRSILRQDPDIIMIGEIRDGETAEIAVRAAITGHLVLSTIHTNDAPSTIFRLVDMGIEPFLAATAIVGVIAQRLVRRICPNCKEEYKAGDHEKKILGVEAEKSLTLYKGRGCTNCNSTGYKGRIGVYEIMEIDRNIRGGIMDGINADELRDLAIKNGMYTLRSYASRLVREGITTLDELIKVAYVKE